MTHPNWRALALCELFLGKSKQTLSTLLTTPATDQRSLPPNLASRTNQWVLGIFTGAWVSGYYQERGNLNRSCITTAVHSSCSDGVTLQLHFHRLYALAALKTVWGLGWISLPGRHSSCTSDEGSCSGYVSDEDRMAPPHVSMRGCQAQFWESLAAIHSCSG